MDDREAIRRVICLSLAHFKSPFRRLRRLPPSFSKRAFHAFKSVTLQQSYPVQSSDENPQKTCIRLILKG